MPTETTITKVVYSPASLVSIFSNSFKFPEEKEIIQVRGIFLKIGTVVYANGLFNRLKDESSDKSITLVTPALINNSLENNTTILVNGFLTRQVKDSGSIQLNLNLIDLVNTTPNKYSEEDLKRIEIINAKLKVGLKDLDSHLKKLIYNNAKIRIGVITPRTNTAEKDILKELGVAVAHYELNFMQISFSSVKEISEEIIRLDNSDVDFICVTRGGGDGFEPFSKAELIKTLLDRKKIIVSALGHDIDVPLFEQVADKKFATPTAFGSYLSRIYNETIEELSKSKAKMQKDIEDRLKVNYEAQMKTIDGKLQTTIKLYAEEKKTIIEANENLKKQMLELNQKKIKDLNEQTIKEKAIHDEQIKTINIKLENVTKLYTEEKKSILEINDRKFKDLNEQTLKLKEDNDRLAVQLNDARKTIVPIPSTNYTPIIISIVLIIIILFLVFGRK